MTGTSKYLELLLRPSTNRLRNLLLVRLAPLQLGPDALIGRDELAVKVPQAAQLVKEQLHLGERDFVAGKSSKDNNMLVSLHAPRAEAADY